MKWYIFCRSALILFVILSFWLITNIFTNVPPDFTKSEGNIIHKELVDSELVHKTSSGTVPYYTYKFSYINKSGKILHETHEFNSKGSYYKEFINNDKYYTDNDLNIGIFIFLCLYASIGTFITLICGNDMHEYFSSEKYVRIKARNMRINHFKILCDFYGYNNKQDMEDTHAAIEKYRENEYNYRHALNYGYTIKIPKWKQLFEDVKVEYDNIVNERKNKESNITDGKQYGGFSD